MMVFADVIMLVVHQIRECTLELAARAGQLDLADWLESQPLMRHEAGRLRNLVGSTVPLTPTGLDIPHVKAMAPVGRAYDEWLRSAGPRVEIPTAGLAELAYLHRRYRSIQFAKRAYKQEALHLGENYRPEHLVAREAVYILTAETAALLAVWSPIEGVQRAAATALAR